RRGGRQGGRLRISRTQARGGAGRRHRTRGAARGQGQRAGQDRRRRAVGREHRPRSVPPAGGVDAPTEGVVTGARGPMTPAGVLLAALAAAGALPATAEAQKFPTGPITYIVPLAAGSTTDVAARTIAQRVSQAMGARIVVENKPGASTMLGSAAVAKA